MKLFHVLFVILIMLVTFLWAQHYIDKSRQSAINEASNQLELTRDVRIAQLSSNVKTIYSEIRFWTENKKLSKDMEKIFSSWYELSFAPKVRARQLYITNNPLHPNYSEDYYKATDGSAYSESHQQIHTLLKGLNKRRGYYDVLLIAQNGDIVYSVFKEDDYATNLLFGKYKETNLAKGFREVLESTNLNHVSLVDFESYAPSNNAPSSFLQTSIINSKNKTIGVLAFQLPPEPINKILAHTSGLNIGTEIFAVGSDHLLRNKLNEINPKTVLKSTAIDMALDGKSGAGVLNDYNGNSTISAYAPFNFSHNILGSTDKNTWAIIVKQDLKEVLKPVNAQLKKIFIKLGILALISLLFAWLFTRGKDDVSTTEEL